MLTERECRGRERSQTPDDERYSVEVLGRSREDRQRWPDLVLEINGRRIAVEIEFSPKYTPWLADIVSGHRSSSYERVSFYVVSPRLGARIAKLAADGSPLPGFPPPVSRAPTRVLPWPGLDPGRGRPSGAR